MPAVSVGLEFGKSQRAVENREKWKKTDCKIIYGTPTTLAVKGLMMMMIMMMIASAGPVYFSDLLKIYAPSRQLQFSAHIRILCIPSVNTKSYGERSFSYTAPTLWNTLPKDIRFSQSVSSFRSALKTHLIPT